LPGLAQLATVQDEIRRAPLEAAYYGHHIALVQTSEGRAVAWEEHALHLQFLRGAEDDEISADVGVDRTRPASDSKT
jgi:hypothetical protein